MATFLAVLISFAVTATASPDHRQPFSPFPPWTPIFRCIDEPGSDVQFYALDLEDIQSLIVESNAQKLRITGSFGSKSVSFTSKNSMQTILSETILKGRALSSYPDSQNWAIRPSSFPDVFSQSDGCSDKAGAYIPNVWFEACDNEDGLHIIRNGTASLCTFKKKDANSVASDITISIDANTLPALSDQYTETVFDNADAFETWLAETAFPTMTFITAADYAALGAAATCLIDTRAEEEWAVSRIQGTAVRIGWSELTDTEINELVADHCNEDALIVFYCAVSYRAALMGNYFIDNLGFEAGRIAVLQGSISRWADERRPLVNDDGPTTFVHTYDADNGNAYVLTEYRFLSN